MRLRHFPVIALAALFLLLVLGHWSGNRPRLDAVEAARRELGIDIAGLVAALGYQNAFVAAHG